MSSLDQYTSLDVVTYGLVDGRSGCRRRTYMVAHACMGFGVKVSKGTSSAFDYKASVFSACFR